LEDAAVRKNLNSVFLIAKVFIMQMRWVSSLAYAPPYDEYLALGETADERSIYYQSLFHTCVEQDDVNNIRNAVNKHLGVGENRFALEIEENFKRRVMPLKVGRKRKEILLCSQF